MADLVGNSRGPYTQLPPALNAAIVLLWKMKGFVCLRGCVEVQSMAIFTSWTLDTADQDQGLLFWLLSCFQEATRPLVLQAPNPLFFCLSVC